MLSVEIVDRSSMTEKLYQGLSLDPAETAIVTIDMHRGHLDPAVATMPTSPEDAKRVIANARELFEFRAVAKHSGDPREAGFSQNSRPRKRRHDFAVLARAARSDSRGRPAHPNRRSTVEGHNLQGSPGTELIPQLFDPRDYVIDNKKRLDCFYGTDLLRLLQTLGAKNVCLMGINTNTCVLNTAFTAFNYDFRVVVLSECVASMYGDDLHVLGLQNVARCIGWVISNEQFRERVAAAEQSERKLPAGNGMPAR